MIKNHIITFKKYVIFGFLFLFLSDSLTAMMAGDDEFDPLETCSRKLTDKVEHLEERYGTIIEPRTYDNVLYKEEVGLFSQ